MDKIVFSSLIAVNGMLTSHCRNLSTHRYHLYTNLVLTRNFVTARPRNNIFVLLPCLQEKSESDRGALLSQGECFDIDKGLG